MQTNFHTKKQTEKKSTNALLLFLQGVLPLFTSSAFNRLPSTPSTELQILMLNTGAPDSSLFPRARLLN